MKMVLGVVFGVLGGTAVFGAELASPAEVEAYAKQMISALTDLNDASRDYGRQIGPAIVGEGQPVDLEAVRKAYAKVLLLHAKAERQLRAMKTPDHPAAAAFRTAFLEFARQQGEMLRQIAGQSLDVLEDEKRTAGEKKTRINQILEEITEVETPQLKAVNAAYQEMKKGISLKN